MEAVIGQQRPSQRQLFAQQAIRVFGHQRLQLQIETPGPVAHIPAQRLRQAGKGVHGRNPQQDQLAHTKPATQQL